MALINESQVLGSGSTDLILNTRGKIYVRVNDRFYELNFKGGGNEGNTVVNNTTINNPEQDLSPYVTKKYLKAALGEYVTKRNWEDVMQTKEALENAQLDGFTESITPITVNTMQMVVGTQNLQFDFINSLTDATVVPPSLYINESEQLVCPRGVIKHYTLFGPESVKPNTSIEYYARWTIQGDDGGDYALLDLEEEDKPYYVYLIVPTTNFNKYTDDYVIEHITEDPKGQYTGNWFASVEPHAIDELEGYAYLLVAIVTGSNAKGRSIGYLNGFTEILPGQITAYVFKTADGDQYLDFLNRNFKIGDDKSYMSWNTTDGLIVKGKISVIGGDLYDELDNLQKQIDDEIQAWFTSDNPNIENPHVLPSPRLDGDIFIEDILWPTTDWTTDSIKKEHLGDLYYITEGDYSGKIFRYIKDSSNSSINFYWIEVVDNALAEAVKISYIARSEAQNAQNSANNLNQHIISSLSDGVLTQSEIINLENYLKNLQISYGELKRTYDILYQNIFLDTTKKDELKTYFNSLNETYKSLINSVNDIISQSITDPGTTNSELKNLNNIFITAYDNFILALNNYQNKVIEIQKIINTKIDDNFNNYKYLTESLARSENTEIKGGLVLTSMIELGSKLSNNFEVTAGINGLTIKPDKNDIAFWAGGDFIDKQYDTISENDRLAKIVLRHDGTGYLANGNISWDKDGYGWVGGDGNNYAIKWNDNGIFLGSGIKITESGQETLATLLEAVTKLQSWFGYDETNKAIYIKKQTINGVETDINFYTFGDSAAGGPGSGGGGGVNYLYMLEDVPDYRTSYRGKYLRAKSDGSGVEWVDVTGGVSSVISLTGDITQSQLRTALGLGSAAYTDSSAYATATQGSHGETAYGWGNHAGAGYLKGITSSMVTSALGYTPYNAADIGSALVYGILTNNTNQDGASCYDANPGLHFYRYNGDDNTIGGGDGWILQWSWIQGSVGGQIYLDDNPSKTIGIRGRDIDGTFTSWSKIALTSDIPTNNNQLTNGAGYITSSGSCAYATSAGNADTLDGYHASYFATASSLENYLPLSGGTLSNPSFASQLTINRAYSGGDAVIKFTNGNNVLGYIGVRAEHTPVFYGTDTSGTGNLIYHSGNLTASVIAGLGTLSNNISGNAATATNADKLDGHHHDSFAKIKSPNNLIYSGDEFTFVPSGYTGRVWINYRTTGGANGNIKEYCFGNGAGGSLATISYGQFSGNAATATKLQTARTIWGQSFDGTGDIATSRYAKMSYVIFKNYNDDNDAGFCGRGAAGSNHIYLTAYSGNTVGIGSNGTNDVLYINHSLNVGIGTTSPSEKLHVVGNILASGAITAGTASDSRLKSNIATLVNASSVLRQLRGVGFDWNTLATDKSSYFKGHDVGLIAQEVEPLIPSAIGTIWGEYKRLDYTKITPYLVEGWKEHDDEIQRLKTKIKQLEERIYGLEK